MTTEQNKQITEYILGCIDSDGYDVPTPSTDRDKLQFLSDVFHTEYGWHIDGVGPQAAFAEWCQGLPSSFNIKSTNYDILELAKKWNSIPANATERQERKILDNYWNFIAAKTLQMFHKNGVA